MQRIKTMKKQTKKIKYNKNKKGNKIKKKIIKTKRKRFLLKHRLTRLKNKSRKGIYIGIRDKELKKERLYKWYPEYGIQYYKEQYKAGTIKKRKKGVKAKGWQQKEQYLRKIKKRGRMDEWLKKGMGTAEITNISKIDRYKIKGVYKEMIKPLLSERYKSDNLILNVFSTEENIKKLKERIEIEITISGEENEEIKLNAIGKTLEEITPLLRINLGHGNLQKNDVGDFMKIGFTVVSSRNVDLSKYDKPYIKVIKNSKLKIYFRKAK